MILKRIVEFAEKHASDQPPGYQPRFVTKAIRLRKDGSLVDVMPVSGTTKSKGEGSIRFEPQEAPQRSSNVVARLVTDNVNYVLGMAREKDKPRQVEDRHTSWKALMIQAAAETNDPLLAAIAKWICAGGPESLRADVRIGPDDELTFDIEGVFPTDTETVRNYWTRHPSYRAFWDDPSGNSLRQCMISGLDQPIAGRMPSPLKNIPGGQTSGNYLIAVNMNAGESYGASAAVNSPIGVVQAERLCNGLNILLNDGHRVKDEKGKERIKYKYALRVGPSVYVAWCREREERIWDSLDDPDPEHVQQLIQQATTGTLPPNVQDDDFYMLSLSANSARIIVRDHYVSTLSNVKTNLGEWFKRLELQGIDGGRIKPTGIYRLASSLYRDANKEMPARVPTDLINAALKGRPLPNYLLGLAVKRNLAMQGPFFQTPAKTKVLATSRMALIKAALTQDPEDTSLTELNQEQSNPAYHCGRMLAVLESIQRISALPSKLNATLVDRNYGAACASPASIFGNLLKDATSAHLPKLRKNRPGAYHALDQRLQEVALQIPEFPKTLALKDQGLFSLGYYHQRASDFAEARKSKELQELADVAAAAGDTE